MSVPSCLIVDLPKVTDSRGNLTFVEGTRHIPFEIQRVFYLYDVPRGADRGGHALKSCHQFLIAMNGRFDVMVDDGVQRQGFSLDRANMGLHVPPMVWREMRNFSQGSVCLVLASAFYEEGDYIRTYDEFLSNSGRGLA